MFISLHSWASCSQHLHTSFSHHPSRVTGIFSRHAVMAAHAILIMFELWLVAVFTPVSHHTDNLKSESDTSFTSGVLDNSMSAYVQYNLTIWYVCPVCVSVHGCYNDKEGCCWLCWWGTYIGCMYCNVWAALPYQQGELQIDCLKDSALVTLQAVWRISPTSETATGMCRVVQMTDLL